jgi:hypothetical protein
MDIRQIALQLITELEAGAQQQKWQSQGVALFYNKMIEVTEKEAADLKSQPTPQVADGPEEAGK